MNCLQKGNINTSRPRIIFAPSTRPTYSDFKKFIIYSNYLKTVTMTNSGGSLYYSGGGLWMNLRDRRVITGCSYYRSPLYLANV